MNGSWFGPPEYHGRFCDLTRAKVRMGILWFGGLKQPIFNIRHF